MDHLALERLLAWLRLLRRSMASANTSTWPWNSMLVMIVESMLWEIKSSHSAAHSSWWVKASNSSFSMNVIQWHLKLNLRSDEVSQTNSWHSDDFLVVEKYSKTTRFCLICNYVAKIIPALQSRCTRFRFGPLTDQSVSIKLAEVCQSENIELDDEASAAIVKLAGGDMRKVLNILESCSLAYREISTKKIFEVTGRPSPSAIEQIYNSLTTEDF